MQEAGAEIWRKIVVHPQHLCKSYRVMPKRNLVGGWMCQKWRSGPGYRSKWNFEISHFLIGLFKTADNHVQK